MRVPQYYLYHAEICPVCRGSGAVEEKPRFTPFMKVCPCCHGTCWVPVQNVSVAIGSTTVKNNNLVETIPIS